MSSEWERIGPFNAAYLAERYSAYEQDPSQVDPDTAAFFSTAGPPPPALGAPTPGTAPPKLSAAAAALASAIRAFGFRGARLDPLGSPPPDDADLHAETHGIREEDLALLPASIVSGPVVEGARNASEVIARLRAIYQGATGYDFEHLSSDEERAWLRDAIESRRYYPPSDPIDPLHILQRLTDVGAFERFLQAAFPGQTRFSLEGLGMMVPMLDEIVGAAAEAGTRTLFLGMAHRGRLNVLAHVLGKSYEQIIAEFSGRAGRPTSALADGGDFGFTGDVKYHLGARRAVTGGQEVAMSLVLAPNPSHLEWVNPVVLGMDRAADERRDRAGSAAQDEQASTSILIHGDASFTGQGVVAETLNLSRLAGYRVGGTLHVIANNQVGFTTEPEEGRSTLFASDLAKGFEIPVIHVNADDPEACIAAARLAHAYRDRFRKDVLIDLIGYRRWGHNEGDEPGFTQPLLYDRIRRHPTVRQLWAAELIRRELITPEDADRMMQEAMDRLHAVRKEVESRPVLQEPSSPHSAGMEAGGERGGVGHSGAAEMMDTAVDAARLATLNEELHRLPDGFRIHPKLERAFARRGSLLSPDADPRASVIDWAHAEALAFASILADGTPIRLTGQDSARGTFSQRHAVLHDCRTGELHVPLQRLAGSRASFEVWNSPLSEQATLGYEFGYSVQAPEALVIWEAQYGDFVNVPQAVIDQFIVSARSKWDQLSSLVMLLPHGYEGQGPEHSSARPERFLLMAAEDNLRIANCTTAAQYFHMLRRQVALLAVDPRPLVLLTPKSLLRNPMAASSPLELCAGQFHPVLREREPAVRAESVRRLVFCSGKVYYDVTSHGAGLDARVRDSVAIVRIEELYPFPADEVGRVLNVYPRLEQVVWLQEEPRNMGAWLFVAPRLRDIIRGRFELTYVGRTRRSSPAEGSGHWHQREQQRIVEAVYAFEQLPDAGLAPAEVEHAG